MAGDVHDLAVALVGALTEALTGAQRRNDSEILATLKELKAMSNSHTAALTDAVTKLSADMSQLKSDLTAGIADLKAQVAAGQTPDFTAIDAAVEAINTLDQSATDMSAAVKAAAAPGPVVFNSADPTPNSAGARNSSQLPNFDPTKPETA